MCLISRLILIYLSYQIQFMRVCVYVNVSYMQACMFITLLLPSSSYSVCASSRDKKNLHTATQTTVIIIITTVIIIKWIEKNSLEHSQQWKSRSSESQTHTNETCDFFLFPIFSPLFWCCCCCAVSHTIVDENFFAFFFYFVFFCVNFFWCVEEKLKWNFIRFFFI